MALLTTQPYIEFVRGCPYFDSILIDSRSLTWELHAIYSRFQTEQFDTVYDLQTSNRSAFYFQLMRKPLWSGISTSCAYKHENLYRDSLHTIDRQVEQLSIARIVTIPSSDLSWVKSDESRLVVKLQHPFIILVVGGSLHRLAKHWPVDLYTALIANLIKEGYVLVLIGTTQDERTVKHITTIHPQAINLLGQTSLADLVSLGRSATAAVGNDTGPMHILAVSGCPCVMLYGTASDPGLCAPHNLNVTVLRAIPISSLKVVTVLSALSVLLSRS